MSNSDDKKASKLFEDAKNITQSRADEIKHDVEHFGERAKHAAIDLNEKGKKAAEDFYHHAQCTAHDVMKQSKEKLSDAMDSIDDCSDELIKAVRKNPVQSLLLASGVGFLLAALLKK